MRISAALPLATFALVLTAACGSQTVDSDMEASPSKATSTPTTKPSSCLDMWDDTREEAVADGQEDGDARRLADDAVAQCLEQTTSDGPPTTQAPSQEGACAQPSNKPQQNNAVDVYYFCAVNGTTVKSSHPIDTAPDLQAALTTYFAGPNDAERKRGLSAPLGPVLADAQFDLSGSDGKYEVSFEPGTADTIGGMATGQSQLFIEGVRRTISQFDAVQSVTLTEAGDCDAFWRAAEMVCNPIERSN